MFLTLVFKTLKINLTKEKKGAQNLVIKEIYAGKDENKGKDEKSRKGKGKQVESEDSMSSFSFGFWAEDIRTKIDEKIKVPKETFKMMKNIQKALNVVNNILDDSSKLQQAMAQDRDASLMLVSQKF